jgi:hypothetical protein
MMSFASARICLYFTLHRHATAAIRLRSRQFCIPQRHDISHRMKMQGKIPS